VLDAERGKKPFEKNTINLQNMNDQKKSDVILKRADVEKKIACEK